jgi:hypothetical protein
MELHLLPLVLTVLDVRVDAFGVAGVAVAVVGTIVRQLVWMTFPTRVVVQVLVRVCADASAANDATLTAATAAISSFFIFKSSPLKWCRPSGPLAAEGLSGTLLNG